MDVNFILKNLSWLVLIQIAYWSTSAEDRLWDIFALGASSKLNINFCNSRSTCYVRKMSINQ